MLSLLRAEFCKNLRDKRLYLMIAVTFVLFFFFWSVSPIRSVGWLQRNIRDMSFAPIAAANGWTDISGNPENIAAFFDYYIRLSVTRVFSDATAVPFLSFYSAAILIGTGFTQRTIDIPVVRGVSRLQVYLSFLISFLLLNTLILLLCLFGFLFLKFGTAWISLVEPAWFLRCLGLWLLPILSFLMLTFAAVWVMKNVFGTILVSAGLLLVQIIAAGLLSLIEGDMTLGVHQVGHSLRTFLPFWFLGQRELMTPGTVLSAGELQLLILIPLGYTLISAVVGWFAFRRRELR